METRANYVLVGLFALAGFLGLLGFFLWFANIEIDRQFAYYDIDFDSVSGLGNASDVRFSGLPVGQVVDVRLSPRNDGRVRVRVEIDAATPVRTDSVATIESQGVTGVSFVGISSGSPDAPLLSKASDEDIPTIEAGTSVLQSLSRDAPQILAETLGVVRDIRELIGGENQARVERILANVEQSSAAFSRALEDFSAVSGTVTTFAQEIDDFNATLEDLSGEAATILSSAGSAIASFEALSEEARATLARGGETLDLADDAIAAAGAYITDSLAPATDRLRTSATDMEARLSSLGDRAEDLIAIYARTGETATARLEEARATLAASTDLLARIEASLDGLDAAVSGFDALVTEDARPLVAELRVATEAATTALRTIGETAETDLPAIFAEIRTATETAARVVETVGADLSSASGRVDGLAGAAETALADASATFARANETLGAINAALETGDRALLAAERAFDGADRVIGEDVSEIAGRLRAAIGDIETLVASVAAEVPETAADLRAAARSAEVAFAGIEGAVSAGAPAVRDFTTAALPQFGRLAVETRALIDNLDTLVEQIRRDPGRFFLDPRAPEFRR